MPVMVCKCVNRASAGVGANVTTGKHRGKFKWKTYSVYNGNLKGFYTDRSRVGLHHICRCRNVDE